MKNIVYKFLILVFLVLMIYSGFNISLWYKNNRANKKINKVLHEYVVENKNDEYSVDFSKIADLNSDSVLYLKVNGTKIDYIVVQGKDNEYYLNHNFNKENNRSGWIFLDYKNRLDGTDKNLIIYGHNTKDGSMFGTLRKVITSDWYLNKDNHIITVVDKNNKTMKYQVFSTYKVDNEEYYIQTEFTNDDSFKEFLNTIKKRSVYNYKVDVDSSDKILTLSTCAANGTKRDVLHAKLIVENEE